MHPGERGDEVAALDGVVLLLEPVRDLGSGRPAPITVSLTIRRHTGVLGVCSRNGIATTLLSPRAVSSPGRRRPACGCGSDA